MIRLLFQCHGHAYIVFVLIPYSTSDSNRDGKY